MMTRTMQQFGFCVMAAVLLAACQVEREPEAPPATGDANEEVRTPAEMSSEEVRPEQVPLDSLRPALQKRLAGAALPEVVLRTAEGELCYAYAAYVVRVATLSGRPGETIRVMARSGNMPPAAACAGAPILDLAGRQPAGTFAGLVGGTLFIDQPADSIDEASGSLEGRTLAVIDVEGNAAAREVAYQVSPRVVEGRLLFGDVPRRYASAAQLRTSQEACPRSDSLFAAGRAVGVSRWMQMDLDTGAVSATDSTHCVALP